MTGFIGANGYYEGDKAEQSDLEVAKRPSQLHEWNGEDWVLEISTLKLIKRAEVNEKRNLYEVAGFPYMGKVFDSDPRSFYRITTANDAAAKDSEFSIEWTVADNTKLPMNTLQMLGVMPALASFGQLIFTNSENLKSAIEAAETISDLSEIDIESGWPDINDYL
jgi:hypothetical protein